MHAIILTKALFDKYPVWAWDESHDGHCPVTQTDRLLDLDITLFIRARFEAPAGEEFAGYLIGRRKFYAFGLFVGDAQFLFNLNLPTLIHAEKLKLLSALGKDDFVLFPIRYESDVRLPDEPDIIGVLSLKGRDY